MITMMATDQDEGSNGEQAYSLEGPGAEAFHVDMDSGLVTTQRPLQSYERFNLTVVATDGGQPPLWGTTMLLVEVIDVNDNRPVFVRPPNGTVLHIREVLRQPLLPCPCSHGPGWGTETRQGSRPPPVPQGLVAGTVLAKELLVISQMTLSKWLLGCHFVICKMGLVIESTPSLAPAMLA